MPKNKFPTITKNSEFLIRRNDSYDKFKKILQSDEITSYNINKGILLFKRNKCCHQCNSIKICHDDTHDEFYCNECGIILKERS
jgi:ribosomal protein S27E